MSPIGYTERGFANYADFPDNRGNRVRLRESSAATVDCHVGLFVDSQDGKAGAHLEAVHVRLLIDGLQEWLAEHTEHAD